MINVNTPLPFNGNRAAEAALLDCLKHAAGASLSIYFTRDGQGLLAESPELAANAAMPARDAAFFTYCAAYMKVAHDHSSDLSHDRVAHFLMGGRFHQTLVDEVSDAMSTTFEVLNLDGPAQVSRLLIDKFGKFMVGETALNYGAWHNHRSEAHNSHLFEVLYINILDTLPKALSSSRRVLQASAMLDVPSNLEASLTSLRKRLFPDHLHANIAKNTLFPGFNSEEQSVKAGKSDYIVYRSNIVGKLTFSPPVDLVSEAKQRFRDEVVSAHLVPPASPRNNR